MNQLTVKEEKFVEAYIESGSNSVAYKAAYSTDNMKDATIHNNGYKILNRPHVKNEVKTRRAELAEVVKIDQAEIIQRMLKIYDDYNEGVHAAKSTDKNENKKAYRIANFVTASAALSSLQDVAKMLGLNAPTATEINNGVVINIINPSSK